jgi:hypothetical protein
MDEDNYSLYLVLSMFPQRKKEKCKCSRNVSFFLSLSLSLSIMSRFRGLCVTVKTGFGSAELDLITPYIHHFEL